MTNDYRINGLGAEFHWWLGFSAMIACPLVSHSALQIDKIIHYRDQSDRAYSDMMIQPPLGDPSKSMRSMVSCFCP